MLEVVKDYGEQGGSVNRGPTCRPPPPPPPHTHTPPPPPDGIEGRGTRGNDKDDDRACGGGGC
jgi:hypothetical protein